MEESENEDEDESDVDMESDLDSNEDCKLIIHCFVSLCLYGEIFFYPFKICLVLMLGEKSDRHITILTMLTRTTEVRGSYLFFLSFKSSRVLLFPGFSGSEEEEAALLEETEAKTLQRKHYEQMSEEDFQLDSVIPSTVSKIFILA